MKRSRIWIPKDRETKPYNGYGDYVAKLYKNNK